MTVRASSTASWALWELLGKYIQHYGLQVRDLNFILNRGGLQDSDEPGDCPSLLHAPREPRAILVLSAAR